MRKYGRYCVNNRRSSIIIENNLQVILMSASVIISTRKRNCWNVLMMTIVVLKLLSQQKCLSLPIISQEALACSIYPFASQNLRITDSKLQTLQNCSCSPCTSSSKASPSEWTPSLSNPSSDSPGNQCTYFEHNRFFNSPTSLMGYKLYQL